MKEFIGTLEQVGGLMLLVAGLWQHNVVVIVCGIGSAIGGTMALRALRHKRR